MIRFFQACRARAGGRIESFARAFPAALFLISALMAVSALHAESEVIKKDGYQYELGVEPEFAAKRAVASAWPSDYQANSPYRVWLDDSQVLLGTGEYVDYVWEATSTEALQSSANYTIEFAPSWQRLVIHELSTRRNGEWQDRYSADSLTLTRRESGFENFVYDGQVSALIVFKDVRPNEAIRVRYSLLGSHPLTGTQNGSRHALVWSQPVLEKHVQVRAKPPTKLRYRIFGREAEFSVPDGAVSHSAHQVSVVLRKQEPLIYLDQLPIEATQFPTIQIAPEQTWNDVQKNTAAWFGASNHADASVAELAESLWKKSALSKPAYTLAALRFVQDDIRYFAVLIGQSTHKPNAPERVLSRRYGDCKDKAQLLTALLRHYDIDAAPALVNATRRGAIAADLPDPGSFDHVIVSMMLDGKNYWLDPTMSSQGGDLETQAFPNYDFALPLRNGTAISQLVQMRAPERHTVDLTSEEFFRVEKNANTRLRTKSTWRGENAEAIRAQFANTGERQMRESFERYYTGQFGKQSGKAQLEHQDIRPSNRFEATENYAFPSLWSIQDNDRYSDFRATAVSESLRMPQIIDRKEGLQMRFPFRSDETLVVELPKGARFEFKPPALEIQDSAFRLKRTVNLDGNKLQIRNEFSVDRAQIPVDQLDRHYANRKKALEAASFRVVWRKQNSSKSNGSPESSQARYRKLLEQLREPK